MKFEKRVFMGIELDILTGHPVHDILFFATQVARVAGLKNPKNSAQMYKLHKGAYQVKTLAESNVLEEGTFADIHSLVGRRWKDVWMFSEPILYQMLLRGNSPASEPFRKWVTEEVLPSIRKTGSYNAADSQNPIALAIMDELKSLRGEIVSLRQELQAKTFSLEAPKAVEVSPYEGQPVARQ